MPTTDPLVDAITSWVKSAPKEVRDLIAQKTANVTGPKETKADVNYRPADDPSAKSCATCAHFDGSSGCAVVSGRIDPEHISDRYTPADSTNDSGEPSDGPSADAEPPSEPSEPAARREGAE